MTKELTAEVQNVVYLNPENNYLVARVRAKGEPGLVTIVGNIGQVVPGEALILRGSWQDHPRFGRQFVVQTFEQSLPAGINGIRRYLASGMIRGVGPVMAERMVKRFGERVFDVLDNEPESLLAVDGIGKRTLDKILSSWSEQREIRGLMLFLQSYDVPTTYAGRIFKKYGHEAVAKLQENPYELAYEIRGIGFKTADNMALRLGFEYDSPKRLEAAIVWALFLESERGHLFYPWRLLGPRVSELLGGILEDLLESALDSLIVMKRVRVVELPEQNIDRAVYLNHFYQWEKEAALRLQTLAEHPAAKGGRVLEKSLTRAQAKAGISLSGQQSRAAASACENKVFILTGGPGTGKTTITRVIVSAMKQAGLKIKLAAPTGRAAKRLSEATDHPASTIHRLLQYSPDGVFAHNDENKLKLDALILDETSMLDLPLFVYLLKAMPVTARLVLIGDANQLPSVGPGDVLADLIRSGVVPFCELTEIFRQARESMIVVNAHRINSGQPLLPSPKPPPEADFFWVEQDDPARVRELIVQIAVERVPAAYGFNPLRDVQVITPMHKGEAGTLALNSVLQERLNPGGKGITRGNYCFKAGDRVLQMRNNYEKEVFNGDLGMITDMDVEEGALLVDFDGRQTVYDSTELDELSLAYAISVHKSQGSEYPVIVMPVVTQHYLLLRRNLIYTALTRARNLAVMIGSTKALNVGLSAAKSRERFTHLRYRLANVLAQGGPLPEGDVF